MSNCIVHLLIPVLCVFILIFDSDPLFSSFLDSYGQCYWKRLNLVKNSATKKFTNARTNHNSGDCNFCRFITDTVRSIGTPFTELVTDYWKGVIYQEKFEFVNCQEEVLGSKISRLESVLVAKEECLICILFLDISRSLQMWTSFPSNNTHYLIHFPNLIRQLGPYFWLWISSQPYFREFALKQNFKNLSNSLARWCQLNEYRNVGYLDKKGKITLWCFYTC